MTKYTKAIFLCTRLVRAKLTKFKALFSAQLLAIGGVKLDPFNYLEGALRLFYKLCVKMIDCGSRST